MSDTDYPEMTERGAGVTLFLVSFLLLTLELAQIRLFSYTLFPKIVYAAIAITLLGLGASGTIMAMSDRLRTADTKRLVTGAALAFAATVPLIHWGFAVLIEPRKVIALGEYPLLIALLAGLILPHFLLGLIIARLLCGPAAQVPRRYFANLLGSSLGCLVFIPILPWLGLERMIIGVALAGALLGLGMAPASGGPSGGRRLSLVVAILLVPLLVAAPRVLDFPPRYGQLNALSDALDQARGNLPPEMAKMAAQLHIEREYSRWDAVGRVEIHSLGEDRVFLPSPVSSRFFSQDGSNGSILVAFPDAPDGGRAFFEGTVYGLAYFRGRPDSVLVIGLGGGPDIFSGLHFGARSITGVEINRGAIESIEGPLAAFLSDPYSRPEVQVVCADGRAFLRRTTSRYDVIQLSGVDTGTALAPGSNVMAENYLYTREAIVDLLAVLAPDGVLSILRFGRDPLRLSLMTSEVLRTMGHERPGEHLVVIEQGLWQNLLIKRTPFTPAELQQLDDHLERAATLPRVRVPIYELIGFGLNDPMGYVYHPQFVNPERASYLDEFWMLAREGRELEIFARMPRLLQSVTDDRPFFFFNFFGELRPFLLFWVELTVIAALLILLPLVRVRRSARAREEVVPGEQERSAKPAESSRACRGTLAATLVYFLALGAGYLVVEVALMQRLVVYLGHPSYSISVTLFALLLWSSLGAMTAGRLRAGLGLLRWVLPAIGLCVLALAFDLHGGLLAATEGTGLLLRSLIVALVIAPLGFLMGMPFPVGLSLLGRAQQALVPWAIGVNGLASVVAAVGNIPLAMLFGFRAVLLLGGVIYLLAWGVTGLGALPRRTETSPPA